jgi:hypothetical protein
MPRYRKGSVRVDVRYKGVKESQRAIRGIGRATNRASIAGITEALSYLLEEAKKITPISTGPSRGTLRDSGKIIVSKNQSGIAKGTIIFTAPYAVWVHECVTKHHKSPTQAKFLENTVRDPRKQRVASAIMADQITRKQSKVPGVKLKGRTSLVVGAIKSTQHRR